jgi:hypothetical protein
MRVRAAAIRTFRNGLALATVLILGSAGTAMAHSSGPISGWRQTGHTTVSTDDGGEGLATVHPAGGPSYLYYRNGTIIPQPLKDEGWGHVGDPDSQRGYLFDAYQNTKDTPAPNKMFLVTTPSGQSYEYTHTLTAEEPPANANSTVAVTPDGRWMVGAALGELSQLFVFPTPIFNRATPKTGGDLPLAGHLLLDKPVRNLQGCDFVSPTRLICGTSDPNNDLFPTNFQLLQLTLAHPLRGTDTPARVNSLGQVPLVSTCTGNFVTEGVDFDDATGSLRVEVVAPSPCNTVTDVYTFRRG